MTFKLTESELSHILFALGSAHASPMRGAINPFYMVAFTLTTQRQAQTDPQRLKAFDGRQFYDLLVAVAKRHHIVGLVLDKDPPIDPTFWDDMAVELANTIRNLQ